MQDFSDILQVNLGDATYPIIFGEGLIADCGTLIKQQLKSSRAIIITDSNVAKHYLDSLQKTLLAAEIEYFGIIIPYGEASKSFTQYQEICEAALAQNPDRNTCVIALGGGVVGDLAGFVAATLLRGLPFVQVPTTLLSQVDSSVGGKVAINSAHGKNLIGAFYQPKLVLMDLSTLKTLQTPEWLSGYGEIIKYGLLGDEHFYNKLIATNILQNQHQIKDIIKHCCQMKAEIVAEDEREQGRRALLNLGHTFGHAIEKMSNFEVLHGQAVALGCLMAARLSSLLNYNISAKEISNLSNHYQKIGLPTKLSYFPTPKDGWNSELLTNYCYGDKKASGGNLNFIVIEKIGVAKLHKNIDAELITQIFNEFN
jgi:3-dehydroquinate synthase